jgi:dipeptidyl aminopeptidase B
MAVAPVTDWRYYDSIYVERYMRTPMDNLLGFQRSAILNTTALSEATRFFVIHGTGDDNVHVQNSLILMDRLTSAGLVNWDTMMFTDDDHNIVLHGAHRAIYFRLAEWLERWFGTKEVGERIWKAEGELLGYKSGVVGD